MYALVRIFIKFISQIENQGARFVSRVTFFLRMNSGPIRYTRRDLIRWLRDRRYGNTAAEGVR